MKVTVTDNLGANDETTALIAVKRQIVSLSPAKVWVSKNLLDLGTKFDFLVEAYVDNTLVSSGEIDSINPGVLATAETIPFNSFSPVDFPNGSALKAVLYVRNACTGSQQDSGTAKLYYNSNAYKSSVGENNTTYYLRDGFILSPTVGASQKSIAVAAGAKCSDFKSFGTWSITP